VKVFVWQRVNKCTDNWHEEGGIVVFAETEDRARELANAKDWTDIKSSENPDAVRECGDGPEQVFLMPDAGCC